MKFKAAYSRPKDSTELREEVPRKPSPVRLNVWHRGNCRKHRCFVCHRVSPLEERTRPVATVSCAPPHRFVLWYAATRESVARPEGLGKGCVSARCYL